MKYILSPQRNYLATEYSEPCVKLKVLKCTSDIGYEVERCRVKSVKNDQCYGSQNAQNAAVIEKVGNLTKKHRHFTVWKTAAQVEISTESTYAILYDYGHRGWEIFSQASVGGTEKTPYCICAGPTGSYQR
ncbi:hypothetical protein TNCV_1499801 [Trichonephila clavipes]|nr:hypothetical protein TNCV_1499801 [Trichonephila clavipes]